MKNLSINTDEYYFMDWPEWMPHLRKYGFDCMEISINKVREMDKLGELETIVKKSGVTVTAVHDWFHFFSPNDAAEIKNMQQRLMEDLEYAKKLGTDRLIWYTGGNDSFEGKAAIDELAVRLKPVIKKAAELNVILLLETEFSKERKDPSASVELLKYLFEKVNSPYLACNFDAANLYVAGEEPFPYGYEKLKPWIKYVHIKDVMRVVPGVHSADDRKGKLLRGTAASTCCSVGSGAVNFMGLFNALKADGYDGYLSMELHMKDEYQDETLERSLDFVRRYGVNELR